MASDILLPAVDWYEVESHMQDVADILREKGKPFDRSTIPEGESKNCLRVGDWILIKE